MKNLLLPVGGVMLALVLAYEKPSAFPEIEYTIDWTGCDDFSARIKLTHGERFITYRGITPLSIEIGDPTADLVIAEIREELEKDAQELRTTQDIERWFRHYSRIYPVALVDVTAGSCSQ